MFHMGSGSCWFVASGEGRKKYSELRIGRLISIAAGNDLSGREFGCRAH